MDKVCCNCRHNTRDKGKDGNITCRCEIDNSYIGYVQCMEYKCKHWSREKGINMAETERLTVEIISELQDKIAAQYQVICCLDAMNDELQAKLGKIEQIINSEVDPNICNNVGDVRKVQAIKKILEQE